MVRQRLLVSFAFIVTCLGCDRRPAQFPVPQPSTPSHRIDVGIVATLLSGRTTHLARADDGTIWWVQETDGGEDIAFAMGGDGVPRATGLTSQSIFAALAIGESARPISPAASSTPASGGNIQSLAADADGRVWFYFAGGTGRRDVAAIGSFDPQNGTVRIAAGTDTLRKSTSMGGSLVLARGTIVRGAGGHGAVGDDAGGDALWGWVRHSDISALFLIDAKTGALTRPFDGPQTEGGLLAMTRTGQQLGGGVEA